MEIKTLKQLNNPHLLETIEYQEQMLRVGNLTSSKKRKYQSILDMAIKEWTRREKLQPTKILGLRTRMARRRRETSESIAAAGIPVAVVPRVTRRRARQAANSAPRVERHESLLRNTVKEMLISLRKQAGLTQFAIAAKLGLAAANISRLESGRLTPSLTTIDAYFRACGYELQISAEKINAGQSRTTSQSSSSPTNP